jgi:predicted RNA-binding Zn-ribbon protein involved in translation (DUF1610 family)
MIMDKNNENKVKVCPRCNNKYVGYPALSRRDNKTYICSDCGTAEAMFDFETNNLRGKDMLAAYAIESMWLPAESYQEFLNKLGQ